MNIEQPKFPQSVETSHNKQAFEFSKALPKQRMVELENIFAQAFKVWSPSKA
jgi:hypothetical protein